MKDFYMIVDDVEEVTWPLNQPSVLIGRVSSAEGECLHEKKRLSVTKEMGRFTAAHVIQSAMMGGGVMIHVAEDL